MRRAKLLDRRTIPLTTGDTLVRTDVFVNDPRVLEDVRTPTSFSIHADVVVLRFDREEA